MSLFAGDDSSALNIILRLQDEASAKLKEIQGNFSAFQNKMEGAASASRTFALGLGAAGAGIVSIGGFAIKAAADLEQVQVAFTTMLGSADAADKMIKDLVNFAKSTPFELKDLEQSTKQLLAYGIAQKDIIPDLTALGNIAAGVGMDKMPNLILAFGQVKAATHLTGMELRQFTEAGVPLVDALADELHKPVNEIQDMISKGEIGFPMVQQALANLSGEGGRFNNLMEKQSQTLGGMFSNLQDAWNIFLTQEGQHLLDWAKSFIQLAIYIVQNVLPVWVDRVQALVDWLGRHKEVLFIIAGAITGALVPAIYAAVAAFVAMAVALAPFILGGAIIGGIVAGILWIVKNWDMLKAKAGEVWQAIATAIMTPIQAAIDFVQRQIDKVVDAFNKMKAVVTKPVQVVTNTVSNALSGAVSTVKGLFGFDQGGTVPGPRGAPTLVLAHGQERILSAPQATSASSEKTINIHFDFSGAMIADKDRLINEITQAINRGYRAMELGA